MKNDTDDGLDMSLFDNQDLELNFGGEGLEDFLPPTETTNDGDTTPPEEKNIKPNEGGDDADPENVVGDEDPEGDETDDDSSPNPYSSFASVLSENGLLPSLDLENDEIKSESDLLDAVKGEIDNQGKNWIIDKIGQEGYETLEKGITLAEYQQHQENTLTLEGITEDAIEGDLELSKNIIYQDYLAQGMDETRAMRFLKRAIDAGEETIIEDAKESLASLKVVEAKRMEQLAGQREEAAKEAQRAQEKIDNDLKNAVYNNEEFVKGYKVNKVIQDKVYNSITKIVGKSPEGIMENQLMRDRRENPIDFDTKLYYMYEMTKGFKDFSILENKSKTKATGEFERALKGMKFDDKGTTPGFLNDPDSYNGGFGSELAL